MKFNTTLPLLASAGFASGMVMQQQTLLQQMPGRYCLGFDGEVTFLLPKDSPTVADCEHLAADIRATGPHTWSLSADTGDDDDARELAAFRTCAISVWNEDADPIDVAGEDLIYLVQFYTSTFSRRGLVRGHGKLRCYKDGDGENPERNLQYKIDKPVGGDTEWLADLRRK